MSGPALPLSLSLLGAGMPLATALAFGAVAHLVSAGLFALLPLGTHQPDRAEVSQRRMLGDLGYGARLLWERREIGVGVLTCCLASIIRAPIYRFALPLLAAGALGVGESGFLTLQLASNVGGVLGSLLIARVLQRSGNMVATGMGAWVVSGVGTALVGLGPSWLGPSGLALTLVGLALGNVGSQIAYGSVGVAIQTQVDSGDVGKVTGLYTMIDFGGDYLGIMLLPLVLKWVTVESNFAVGGLVLALIGLVVGRYLSRREARSVKLTDIGQAT